MPLMIVVQIYHSVNDCLWHIESAAITILFIVTLYLLILV